MNQTKIEWCDMTLNPVVGCTYGCEFCYAERMNQRFKWVKDFNKPEFFPERIKQLYQTKPKLIFLDSMSDFADWEYGWRYQVSKAIYENPQHKFLILTKRPEGLNFFHGNNVWNGVSITKESEVSRFNYLPALGHRFASLEPLHEDLMLSEKHNLFFRFVDWVIIGAETGNRKGRIIPRPEWIVNIAEACKNHNIPVFMKDSLVPIIGERNMLREFPGELRKGENQCIRLT